MPDEFENCEGPPHPPRSTREFEPQSCEPTIPINPDDSEFWYSLIDERSAAGFVGLSSRTLQGYRQRGGGPLFCRISSRCCRYRRIDLREWAEAGLVKSTSDPGPSSRHM